MTEPVFTQVLQVALVVRDLERSMRTYAEGYGIGPWHIYEFNPDTVQNMTRDGKPSRHAMRLGLAMIGDVQLELIQPLDDRSIYADFLREHGEGLHHLGMKVDDYGKALATLKGKGHDVLQGGFYNGVEYAYLSTDRDLGVITEIFDWPEDLKQEPDAVYPPPEEVSSQVGGAAGD
jgi:methylmalonyl-CoA/ethylmalonyl-CoA epimerase